MEVMKYKDLLTEAKRAREKAYAPYSKFKVGAALLTEQGRIYTGCNIENAAYTPSICAERTAFSKAVSEGERAFLAIAIVGGMEGTLAEETCAPCGVCRQVMEEFCDPEQFEIVLSDAKEGIRIYRLCELLPLGFGPNNLKEC